MAQRVTNAFQISQFIEPTDPKKPNWEIQIAHKRMGQNAGMSVFHNGDDQGQSETDVIITPEHLEGFNMDLAVQVMSDEMKDYYWTCFKRYDSDCTGSLGAGEVQKIMRDMGLAPRSYSEQKVYAQMLQDIAARSGDERNPLTDGGWTFEEFLLMITVMNEITRVKEEHSLIALCEELGFSEEEMFQFQEVFEQFDEDHSGEIEISELRNLLKTLGQSPTTEQLQTILKSEDKNDNDSLDFREFLKLMKRVSHGEDGMRIR